MLLEFPIQLQNHGYDRDWSDLSSRTADANVDDEGIEQGFQVRLPGQLAQPPVGYGSHPIMDAGQTAGYGGRCVRIFPKIYRL